MSNNQVADLIRVTSSSSAQYGEKPWHRLAVRLHLEGWPNHDIANELRQPVADIAEVITTKDGKKEIAKALEEDEKVVVKILEAAGIDSIYTLIRLRDGAKTESVRYNAAKTLLEHGQGKPLAKIQQINEEFSRDPQAEAEKIREELLLRQQTKQA